MRQYGQQVMAPVNSEPKWPEGYVEALREAGAHEKTIPFCIGWVRRFFGRFPGRRRRDLGRAEIETFLSEITTHPGFSNWQVQQARNALELYYEKFRGIALLPRQPIVESHPASLINGVRPPTESRPVVPDVTNTTPIVPVSARYIKSDRSVNGKDANCRAGDSG